MKKKVYLSLVSMILLANITANAGTGKSVPHNMLEMSIERHSGRGGTFARWNHINFLGRYESKEACENVLNNIEKRRKSLTVDVTEWDNGGVVHFCEPTTK